MEHINLPPMPETYPHCDYMGGTHVLGVLDGKRWVVQSYEAGVLAERERCAKIADDYDTWVDNPAYNIAEKIRKGETP